MTKQGERNKALAILLLSTLPLILEMHGDVNTFVDWRVIIPIILYVIFTFKVTQNHQTRGGPSFEVFMCCSKMSLCVTVFYSWMSLFFNFEKTLVTCLFVQSQGSPNIKLSPCIRYGLVTECVESLSLVNRMNTMSNKCPSSILGPSLGLIYFFSIIVLRFVPTAIYGLWKLYIWDPKDFVDDVEEEQTVEQNNNNVNTPCPKCLLVCTSVLLPCLMVSAALQDVMHLSNFCTALPFLAILVMHYSVRRSSFSDTGRHLLAELMRVGLHLSIAYSILDFVINGLAIITVCIGGEVQEGEILERCGDTQGPISIEQCYGYLSEMDPTFFSRDLCPHWTLPTTTILYIANCIQVVILTFGVLFAFVRKNAVFNLVNSMENK